VRDPGGVRERKRKREMFVRDDTDGLLISVKREGVCRHKNKQIHASTRTMGSRGMGLITRVSKLGKGRMGGQKGGKGRGKREEGKEEREGEGGEGWREREQQKEEEGGEKERKREGEKQRESQRRAGCRKHVCSAVRMSDVVFVCKARIGCHDEGVVTCVALTP
jgi:hypothetical protein